MTVEARLGVTWTEGGKSPIGARRRQPARSQRHHRPAHRSAREGRVSTRRASTAFRSSAAREAIRSSRIPSWSIPRSTIGKLLGRHTLRSATNGSASIPRSTISTRSTAATTYSGQFSAPGATTLSSAQLSQAYGLADFMIGARSSYELNNYVIVDYRQRMHFAYVQDDWKVNRKLTLNLGLRYEFATPQWETDNHLANFDPATNSLIQAKSGSLYDRALVQPRHKYFAPRIGLAYQILPKTVIRSGLRHQLRPLQPPGRRESAVVQRPLHRQRADLAGHRQPARSAPRASADPTTCFRPTQMGYPQNFAVPANFNPLRAQARYIPQDNPTGYVQSWHFTVQREIGEGPGARRRLRRQSRHAPDDPGRLEPGAPQQQPGREPLAAGPPPDPELRSHRSRLRRRLLQLQRAPGQSSRSATPPA